MTTKTDKKLSEKFNIEENEPQELVVLENEGKKVIESITIEKETEYEFVKDNIKSLLDKGENLLDEAINIAKDTEHPRAVEVASNLFKNLVEANGRILDAQIKEQKIKNNKSSTTPVGKKDGQIPIGGDVAGDVNITNIAFTGSSADLHKIIREQQQNLIEEEKSN